VSCAPLCFEARQESSVPLSSIRTLDTATEWMRITRAAAAMCAVLSLIGVLAGFMLMPVVPIFFPFLVSAVVIVALYATVLTLPVLWIFRRNVCLGDATVSAATHMLVPLLAFAVLGDLGIIFFAGPAVLICGLVQYAKQGPMTLDAERRLTHVRVLACSAAITAATAIALGKHIPL
jgi:hypothetical protein